MYVRLYLKYNFLLFNKIEKKNSAQVVYELKKLARNEKKMAFILKNLRQNSSVFKIRKKGLPFIKRRKRFLNINMVRSV